MANQIEKFWMVLASNSDYTSYRHETRNSAIAEAERLATQLSGIRFFVLECIGVVEIAKPTVWREAVTGTLGDEVPF